ncbi:MAG TPA: hypothetical protein VNU21_15230 [Usitatibacter sp.]|nr:hypothetical protein [Usitatibacter sp.]
MDHLHRVFGNASQPVTDGEEHGVLPDDEAATCLGFRPAFLDYTTWVVHPSLHRDGRYAHFHSIEGLPHDLVVRHWLDGHVVRVKPTLIAGYERKGFFYTRTAAARATAEWFVRE